MNDQTKAIVAHITIIGWLISLFMNQSENRTPLTSFYLRQLLGLFLAGLILSFIPIPLIDWLGWMVLLAAWIYSLIGAIQSRELLLPWIGEYFQDWFSGI